MELQDLLSKLDNIDRTVDEGGYITPATMPQPDPKPSMSVNMNAQGDSIKDLLKILSDIDSGRESDLPPMHDKDHMIVKTLDRDGDGDHDVDDHEMEAYANEPDEEEQDIDYMVNKLAGGMNRPKKTYDKRSPGDNPMQKVTDDDVVEHIRTQLEQRLAEYKGK
jgi:hypothetical protein